MTGAPGHMVCAICSRGRNTSGRSGGGAGGDDAPVAPPIAPTYSTVILGSDRKSTRLNSSHTVISYAVFCLKKKIFEKLCMPRYSMFADMMLFSRLSSYHRN